MTAKPSVVQGKEAEDAGVEKSFRSGSSRTSGSFHPKHTRGLEGTWASFFTYLRFNLLFRRKGAHIPSTGLSTAPTPLLRDPQGSDAQESTLRLSPCLIPFIFTSWTLAINVSFTRKVSSKDREVYSWAGGKEPHLHSALLLPFM